MKSEDDVNFKEEAKIVMGAIKLFFFGHRRKSLMTKSFIRGAK